MSWLNLYIRLGVCLNIRKFFADTSHTIGSHIDDTSIKARASISEWMYDAEICACWLFAKPSRTSNRDLSRYSRQHRSIKRSRGDGFHTERIRILRMLSGTRPL